MTSWEEPIIESENIKNMTSAQKKKEAEKILSDIKKEKKEEKENKKQKGSAHTKYLEKQLKFKMKKYEEQKKRQKEKAKERAQREPLEAAKKSLSSIKTSKVSSKDTTATATKKSLENVASLAGGLAGAAFHGVRGLSARKKSEKEVEGRQPEKRERKEPHRPRGSKRNSQENLSTSIKSKKEEPKQLIASTKRLPPSTKKIGPSGGIPYQASPEPSKETGMRLGQRARRNPELKRRLISMREEKKLYSDWKSDFLLENDLLFEISDDEKTKKKKVIDVMRGKNKIEINPNISEDHKEIAKGEKKDDEGYMARIEFETIEKSIKELRKKIKSSNHQLPAWVQSKITRAADYLDSASEYLNSEENIKEEKTPSWQRSEGKRESGGLNKKGVESYRRENPGSKLKTAVTTEPSKLKKGSGSWNRRKSFCARMSGMKKKLTSQKTANDPNSRINKSLRAWNC